MNGGKLFNNAINVMMIIGVIANISGALLHAFSGNFRGAFFQFLNLCTIVAVIHLRKKWGVWFK